MSHRMQIDMPDGGEMGAYLALPESGSGPGMLVLMEIFGVGVYIREAADRLAALGYVALAPDLYRRTRPGAEFAHDDAGLQAAFAAVGRTGRARGHRGRDHRPRAPPRAPETRRSGRRARLLPGRNAGLRGRAAGRPGDRRRLLRLGRSRHARPTAQAIACPVLFQFGGEDAYIPREQAELVAAAAEARAGWECHIHDDGGHAFDNWDAPRFSRPEPAKRAWAQTADFLARTLPNPTVSE